MKEIMLDGWCYTSENVERAQRIINNMKLDLHIKESFAERIAWVEGNKEEIETLFVVCRREAHLNDISNLAKKSEYDVDFLMNRWREVKDADWNRFVCAVMRGNL